MGIKIGQRWAYKYKTDHFIAEVVGLYQGKSSVVQYISGIYPIGYTVYVNARDNWTYLEGQDKPIE
jgi:hypothetical protein